MVDAADLKSVDRKVVWVRVPPWAPRANTLGGLLSRLSVKPAAFTQGGSSFPLELLARPTGLAWMTPLCEI